MNINLSAEGKLSADFNNKMFLIIDSDSLEIPDLIRLGSDKGDSALMKKISFFNGRNIFAKTEKRFERTFPEFIRRGKEILIDNDGRKFKFEVLDGKKYFLIKAGKADVLKKGVKGRIVTKEGVIMLFFKNSYIFRDITIAKITNRVPGSEIKKNKEYFAYYPSLIEEILSGTGFANITFKNTLMIIIGIFFIYIAIKKEYEPLLLVPIGFGIILGNIPIPIQLFNSISIYMIDPFTGSYSFNTAGNSVMGIIYSGVRFGIFPPLIFLGIGAMTDFSAMLSNPKGILLGAAAQTGIFLTFIGALALKFSPQSAASIGIIGGADGPTAIFLSSKLAPELIGPIAIAAYSYMAMVPIIQPPIMKLMTTKAERLIRMKPSRKVSKYEKIIFPVLGFILTTMVAPGAIPLLGMLFFGNLLKESGVTGRLAKTVSNSLIDICTVLLGVAVGASTTAQVFLNKRSIMIFFLGVISFAIATFSGILFAKFMNLFLKTKINPLIGAAGVSAVPDSARVVHNLAIKEDPGNYLLMHAMGPNVAGVIGSAIAAGIFLGIF